MYVIDDRDRVRPLPGVPRPGGTAAPRVVADEGNALCGYYEATGGPDWGAPGAGAPVIVLAFPWYHAMMFGPPGERALHGHPLSARGLLPGGAFEVVDSSWIRALARVNAVHPHHDPARFARLRHVIVTFADSTFECVAPDHELTRHVGPLASVAAWMQAQLSDVR